ncbi:hypothetical protein PAXINDRAFT_11189 [Paxillus involutus ATCC 200175]|nr:hypothetical protein PAXINDRAFT_11189 [Paxillus involutus ATCC 200175]
MPLEGEKGQRSSGHVDEMGTHQVETPRHESRTTPPIRTPHNKGSSREGRGVVIGHRQTVGEKDEVRERYNDTKTLGRVEERQSRREEARDEARDDEEATNANDKDNLPRPSPQPPPSPTHPKRPHHVDTTRSGKTAARLRAGTVHDPGGETDAPGSQPPSVQLEGEKDKASSLYIEADDIDVGTVNHDHDTQQSPRRPVGTPDGDECRPNGPTEPPDEVEGGRGGNSEPRGTSRVETVELRELRRVDQPEDERVEPGDRGVEETKSKEVEGEIGDQSEGNGCQ